MSGLFGNCGCGNNFGCNSGCNSGCDNDRHCGGGGFKGLGCNMDCCTIILILLLLTCCCGCNIDWCTIIVIFLLFNCCGFGGCGSKHGC